MDRFRIENKNINIKTNLFSDALEIQSKNYPSCIYRNSDDALLSQHEGKRKRAKRKILTR